MTRKLVFCLTFIAGILFLLFHGFVPPTRHVSFRYVKQDGPFPCKGYAPFVQWYPWSDMVSNEIRKNITLAYAGIEWKEIEPEQGMYDFDYLDEEFHLQEVKNSGRRIILRILADLPNADRKASIPTWLMEAMGGSGEWYGGDNLGGFSPEYDHPAFLEAHEKLLQAFSQHYGEEFVAYIQMGTVGHYGEWNTTSGGEMPSEASAEIISQHYKRAFPNTPLLFRRPIPISLQMESGYYNDMLGAEDSTELWLSWLKDGDGYYNTPPLPEFWKTGPIGGEFAFGDPYAPLGDGKYQEVLGQIYRSHMTFIGPCMPGKPEPGILTERALEMSSILGYDIALAEAECPEALVRGENSIRLIFENRGIAPLYASLPITMTVENAEGDTVAESAKNIDFSGMDGGEYMVAELLIQLENKLQKGTYELKLSAADSWTGLPFPISNAIDEENKVFIASLQYAGRYSPYTVLKNRIQHFGEQ